MVGASPTLPRIHPQGLLGAARGRAGAARGTTLQQLVLILADGHFHEKESLKRRVRAMADQPNVLLVFIALDAKGAESLLELQTVSFQGGAPTFTKYLDTFPFPYYIVLQDISSLPRTLADLLRQWFEITSASS